ncbi:uncharacterized protein RJT21DRAFT_120035 [Scheffersomyces amazonensis]|uniref:uncharacterized protein n=1 Tax=Scheffersomyces amazonensis TaxID=1078765 RepID=UPI00315CEE07
MNVFGMMLGPSRYMVPRMASSNILSITASRSLSSSLVNQGPRSDKYWKLLKYVKPIDKTVYSAGEAIPKGVRLAKTKKMYPDYEYEPTFFKRQNRGLFGGLQRKRSKNCSTKGFNKTLREHLPNIQRAKLWSETLNKSLSLKVSTKVLKTITKEGGLDSYLLKDKPARIKTLGVLGWKLRYDVMKRQEKNQLPKTSNYQVQYIHKDGKQIKVGKYKLLDILYDYVRRDSYYPIKIVDFKKAHYHLTIEEVVEKLESYSYDFTPVIVNPRTQQGVEANEAKDARELQA